MDRDESVASNVADLVRELQDHRLDDIPREWKLSTSDLQYIGGNLTSSIFGDKCSLWPGCSGSIVNGDTRPKKRPYNNFYHNKKKTALHRLIYSNYVQPLTSQEFIRFNCENKGRCCTVSHLEKHQYSVKNSKKAAKKLEGDKTTDFRIRSGVVVDFQ